MKKLLLLTAVVLLATSTSFAQFKFGFGGAIGTEAGINDDGEAAMNFGLHARALYDLSETFGITGGFTYFFPSKVDIFDGELKVNFMMFNADALYTFMNEGNTKIYGLAGVNYSIAKADFGGQSNTESEFGFEFGAGANFGKFFVEAKYDLNNKQVLGFVGIYIN